MVENPPGLQRQRSKYDEQIKVSVDDIVGQFAECIVCFQTFNDPYITKCGHTFCKDCIFEVVNRQHKCPVCNQACEEGDLIRNYNFGELLGLLVKERDAEKQKWIDRLVNQGVNPQPPPADPANPGAPAQNQIDLGPIQTVFSLNLKDSLLAYQQFYDSMQNEKKELRQKVKSKFNVRMMELAGDDPETLIRKEALGVQLEQQLATIETKFDKSVQFLQTSYDTYMKKAAPVPKFLPIRVNIAWQWKMDKNLENIHINPFDNIDHLINQLSTAYEQRGDPVIDWKVDSLQFKIIGPLAGFDADAPMNEEEKKEEVKGDNPDLPKMVQERLIDDIRAPFASYQLAQGSTIMIMGGPVLFTSDKPLDCMTLNFNKDAGKTYTYFSCKTCNSNWICENCRKACHEKLGHETLLHVSDHAAQSAVCYCVKKKLCKIPNMKDPQNGRA